MHKGLCQIKQILSELQSQLLGIDAEISHELSCVAM